MSWESRNGRGQYYTRSYRRSGRIVREYVGTGRLAILASNNDARKSRERQAALATRKQREREADALEAEIVAVYDLIELMGRAALIVAGYRQHHRSEWRRHRAPRRDAD